MPVGRKRAHQPTQLREISQTKELSDWGKCSRLCASKPVEKVALGGAEPGVSQVDHPMDQCWTRRKYSKLTILSLVSERGEFDPLVGTWLKHLSKSKINVMDSAIIPLLHVVDFSGPLTVGRSSNRFEPTSKARGGPVKPFFGQTVHHKFNDHHCIPTER